MANELTNDDLADVLDKARELMNDEGAHWTKGTFRRTDRKTKEVSYCAVGAIRATTPNRALRQAAYEALSDALESPAPWTPMNRVMWWNDLYTREWPDVEQTFKRLATRLRRRKTRSPYLPGGKR